MKPPPWLLVMEFLLVEIRTEKGTPARSINLESSTLEQEPMRRGGLIELQVPAMINKNIYPSPGKENRKDKTEEEEEACGGRLFGSRNGGHTIRFGACTQHAFTIMCGL